MSRLLLVPLDDVVVFPGMSVTLAVDTGIDEEHVILVPRHDKEFASVGTVAKVTDRVRLPGGARASVLEGRGRTRAADHESSAHHRASRRKNGWLGARPYSISCC